jgi:hypothetical protein
LWYPWCGPDKNDAPFSATFGAIETTPTVAFCEFDGPTELFSISDNLFNLFVRVPRPRGH